jgi:hypothetical protein
MCAAHCRAVPGCNNEDREHPDPPRPVRSGVVEWHGGPGSLGRLSRRQRPGDRRGRRASTASGANIATGEKRTQRSGGRFRRATRRAAAHQTWRAARWMRCCASGVGRWTRSPARLARRGGRRRTPGRPRRGWATRWRLRARWTRMLAIGDQVATPLAAWGARGRQAMTPARPQLAATSKVVAAAQDTLGHAT